MKDLFQNVLTNYRDAYTQHQFGGHPLAGLIRTVLPDAIYDVIPGKERYKIEGSSGAGRWAALPWIAIFDILITTSAQSGYYPVFLFKDDMSGFYLSLNQGVTQVEIEHKYKKTVKQVLELRAQDYKAQIGKLSNGFNFEKINLKELRSTNSKYPSLYASGNIFSKYYPLNNIPEDEELISDINEILKIYEAISYNEGSLLTHVEKEDDEAVYKGFENLKNFRFHKRIERNVLLSKGVKKAQGFICKACKFDFKKKYGSIGEKFIEAHHLVPLSKLIGIRIQLDVRKDFTVLCSNCHRMIHKLDDPSNLEELKKIINDMRST